MKKCHLERKSLLRAKVLMASGPRVRLSREYSSRVSRSHLCAKVLMASGPRVRLSREYSSGVSRSHLHAKVLMASGPRVRISQEGCGASSQDIRLAHFTLLMKIFHFELSLPASETIHFCAFSLHFLLAGVTIYDSFLGCLNFHLTFACMVKLHLQKWNIFVVRSSLSLPCASLLIKNS